MTGIRNFVIASASVFIAAQGVSANFGALSSSQLVSRQLDGLDPSTIPTTCLTEQCSDLLEIMGTECGTGSIDCICSTKTANALQKCFNCIGSSSTFDPKQSMQEFANNCDEAGHPISGFSASGGGGSSSDSSSSAFGGGGGGAGSNTDTASKTIVTATSPGTGTTASPNSSSNSNPFGGNGDSGGNGNSDGNGNGSGTSNGSIRNIVGMGALVGISTIAFGFLSLA